MKSKKFKFIIALVIAMALMYFTYKYAEYMYINVPTENINNYGEIELIIPKGATTKTIAKLLKEKNLILNEDIYRFKSKIYKFDGKYNYGIFEVTANMNNEQIMNHLTTEEGKQTQGALVTIPEGYTIAQIAEKLEKTGICTKEDFLKTVEEFDMKKYSFLNNILVRKNKLEGYLFPETYSYDSKTDAEMMVRMFLETFNKRFTNEYENRAKELGLTIDQIITVASIVEREAKKPEERIKIAGVIYNRLKKNMRLEMCSTVQYAQGKVKEKLLDKDLEIESPYNTYRNLGLPIGPICNPGLESIKAALYPEDSEYLYFVLKDELTGEHHFSKTYAEHIRAKQKYIK